MFNKMLFVFLAMAFLCIYQVAELRASELSFTKEANTQAQAAKSSSGTRNVTLEELVGTPSTTAPAKPPATKEAKTTGMASLMMAASASTSGSTDIRPLSFAGNFSVDPTTGSAVMAVPLFVPAGRNGVGPSLGLSYSPFVGNGPMGITAGSWATEY